MRLNAMVLVAMATLLAGPVQADVCAMGKAQPIPGMDKINSALLAGDFASFATELQGAGGIDFSSLVPQLNEKHSGGFDGCVAVALREDTGGMTQSVILYYGLRSRVSVYWLTAKEGDTFTVLKVSMGGDLDEMLAKLR